MEKKHSSTIFLILALLIGLSLLLYPSVSDYWNSLHASRAIAGYAEQAIGLEEKRYAEIWDAAIEYNESLVKRDNQYALNEEQSALYETMLDISGTGIMGYIEIEQLGVSLPIYHGTDETVLQIAVGHLDWTSLPVGGESAHCVLSGHRGLPSAKLFTDLDKLVAGDTFILRIMNEVLTYEVDQILIVLPHETDSLLIEDGKDLCTLVTCTPYGINSHRLLVRGHRIENTAEVRRVHVTADAVQIKPILVAPVISAPILLVLLIGLCFGGHNKKGSGIHYENDK